MTRLRDSNRTPAVKRAGDRPSSIKQLDLEERWLVSKGVSFKSLDEKMKAARRRAARYPLAPRLGRRFVLFVIDWFAPLLFLLVFRRAQHLSEEEFDHLWRRIREHRFVPIRVAGLFAAMPLMEVVFEDDTPPQPTHPLEERLEPGGLPTHREEFDFVVIGSGAGGAPLAAELAARGASVAVVEKGGLVRPERAHVAIEKYYANQGLLGAAFGTPVIVMAGTSVGGTTSINSGTSLRPTAEHLKRWDETLGTNFADGELAPWLERVERAIGVTAPPDELRSVSAALVDEGLAKLGRDETYPLPRNAAGCRGTGRCCFGCPTGAKQSTDRAFLPDALDAGAELFCGWEATLIRERDDCVEITIRSDGETRRLRADQLVLAAGALFTPVLIRTNRLGTRWRRAGRRFKTHPATKVFAHFPELERPETEPGIPQGLGYRPPDIPRVVMEGAEVPACVTGPMLAAGGERFRWWFERHDELASYGAMVRDRGTGRVHAPFGRPLISYQLDPRDAEDLVGAMTVIARAFFAAGASRVLMPWFSAENEFEDASQLQDISSDDIAAEQMLLSGFHPQGTAGMGRVVDTELTLFGSDRIYICDASVLPDSPGVNPQVTLMALSLRLADSLS